MVQLQNPNARCRPDQLFGAWSIDGDRFAQMVEIAREANIDQLRAQSAANQSGEGRQLYSVDKDGLTVIEISGPMTKYETSFQALFGGTSTIRVRQALRAAARDPEVLGAMLIVDSPGGTVAGTSELAAEVRAFAARKPLFAHVDDGAASAALWGISGSTRISANPGSSIGSIGAFATLRDTSGVYAQRGVKVHVVSSAPPIKGAFAEGTEITQPQLDEAQRQITDIADVFITELAEGRSMSIEKARELATGQVWIASKAKELGLIDDVATLDQAMAQLRSKTMEKTDTTKPAATAAPTPNPTAAAPAPVPTAAAPATPPTPADPATVPTAGIMVSAEELATLRARASVADTLEATNRVARFASLASLLGLAATMGPVLDRIDSSVDEPTFSALESAFKASHAQVKAAKDGQLTPKGTAHPDTAASTSDDPTAQLDAIADQLVKDGKFTTKAAAMKQAAKDHPALYEAHSKARR